MAIADQAESGWPDNSTGCVGFRGVTPVHALQRKCFLTWRLVKVMELSDDLHVAFLATLRP